MIDKKISKVWAYDLLEGAYVTEKTSKMAKDHKVVLKVNKAANKKDIKAACEMIFESKVFSVNTMITKPRLRGFKGKIGRRQSFKKAMVQFDKQVNIDKIVGEA